MKIFMTFTAMLVVMATFADNFDLAKFEQINKTNNRQAVMKYCAESTPTAIGIENKQHFFAISYLIGKKDTKFTKEQVLQIVKPFVNVAEKPITKDMIEFIGLQSANLVQDSNAKAEQIYKKYNVKMQFGIIANRYIKNKDYAKASEIANKYELVPIQLRLAKTNKDYVALWNTSQKILCYKSGVKNAKKATQILGDMFRYKPSTVTKQQQIALIEKLAKIYPVAGTDFNQWKNFVSLISYRYKVLTGKVLK